MRALFAISILTGAAVFCAAAPPPPQRVTVDELTRLLTQWQRESDDSLAHKITALALTQRLSPQAESRLEGKLADEDSRYALMALAAQSSFLSPPPAQIALTAPPDAAAQQKILAKVHEYVLGMRKRLPNFLATRTTTYFEVATKHQMEAEARAIKDESFSSAKLKRRQLGVISSASTPGARLFLLGAWIARTGYRDGQEWLEASAHDGNGAPPTMGLTTSGEFGAVLVSTIADSAHGSVQWDHWERGEDGLLAVFRYQVPENASHFVVTLPYNSFSGLPLRQVFTAYHGKFAVDPQSGAIFRISLIADPDPNRDVGDSQMVVDYGRIDLGGEEYVCPLRGVALFSVFDSPKGARAGPQHISLNEAIFSQYHLFRSDARILPRGASGP